MIRVNSLPLYMEIFEISKILATKVLVKLANLIKEDFPEVRVYHANDKFKLQTSYILNLSPS